MVEITVLSGKGGTGKTSLTAALAGLAAAEGRFQPLICDLDVDAPDLHLLLEPENLVSHDFQAGQVAQVDPDKCTGCGLCAEMCRYGAVKEADGVYSVDPVLCEGCSVCVHFCPEKAIAFPTRLCGQWHVAQTRFGPMIHALLAPGEENSGLLVALLRGEAKKKAEAEGLDLILSDGSPGIGCPVISSLTGTDLAVLVTEPTPSGLHDLERVIELAGHFKRPFGVVINKWDLNPTQSGRIEKLVTAREGRLLGRLNHDPVFIEAMLAGQTVCEHSQGRASKQLKEIWRELKDQLSGLAVGRAA